MPTIAVRDIMTREVVAVRPSTPAREVAALLRERGLSAVPVVDEAGHVLGLVGELDLLSQPGATAGATMSPQVIGVAEQTNLREVAQLFISRRLRSVPVLAAGRLVGMVSGADLLGPATLGQLRSSSTWSRRRPGRRGRPTWCRRPRRTPSRPATRRAGPSGGPSTSATS